MVAIIVGAGYFATLAFENAWMTETAQVLIGGATRAALAYGGTRFARARYSAYGQMISFCTLRHGMHMARTGG